MTYARLRTAVAKLDWRRFEVHAGARHRKAVAERPAIFYFEFVADAVWLAARAAQRAGHAGAAQLSVPVASFGQAVLAMPKALGGLLLVLVIGLALGAIAIVGAAARESRVAPGAEVSPEYRRRGWRAMAIMSVVVGLPFYGDFAWWSADANAYATLAKFFKSPKCAATLTGDRIVDSANRRRSGSTHEKRREMVPDHGHIMHLFLVRTPGIRSRLASASGADRARDLEENLPAIETGHYEVFADIVDKYGFPWTLVGTIDMPNVAGPAMSGDDSEGIAPSLNATRGQHHNFDTRRWHASNLEARQRAAQSECSDDPRIRSGRQKRSAGQ